MNTNSIAATALLFILPVIVSWLLNLPRKERYRQFWAPSAVLVFSSIVIILSNFYLEYVRGVVTQLMTAVSLPLSAPSFPFVLNWLLLMVFVVLKGFVNGWLMLVKKLARIFSRLKSRLTGSVEESAPSPPPAPGKRIPPAYEEPIPGQGIFLRREFFFVGDALLASGFIALLVLLSAVLDSAPMLAYPFLPALSVLLLFELAWYLQGLRTSLVWVEGGVTEVSESGFSDLWEQYQRLWSDRVLIAGRLNQTTGRIPGEAAAAEVASLMKKGENLLIAAHYHGELYPQLFKHILETLVEGKKILVISDAGSSKNMREALQEQLGQVSGASRAWLVGDINQLGSDRHPPDIVITPPDILMVTRGRVLAGNWFERVGIIFMPEAGDTFPHLQAVKCLVAALVDRSRSPIQLIALSAPRVFPETALRCNLPLTMKEHVLSSALPTQQQIIAWRREGKQSFESYLMRKDSAKVIGAEASLSTLAWAYRLTPVLQMNQAELPWYQRAEELQNHLEQRYFETIFDKADLKGTATDPGVFDFRHEGWHAPRHRKPCVVTFDKEYNLTMALAQSLPTGANAVFAHIVSPPYLLRDYLADNIDFFLNVPLLPLTPRISSAPYTMATTLLSLMTSIEVNEQELLARLRELMPRLGDARDGLRKLFSQTFDADIISRSLLKPVREEYRFNTATQSFEKDATRYFSLVENAFSFIDPDHIRWAYRYELVDRNAGSALGHVSLDHLFQRFIPGQVHAFAGNPYSIESVDHGLRRINLEFRHDESDAWYRPDQTIYIRGIAAREGAQVRRTETINGCTVHNDFCEGQFDVETTGYSAFRQGMGLTTASTNYVPIGSQDVPVRRYRNGRLVKLFFPRTGAGAGGQKVAFTLATLLNEIFCSLFPETRQFIAAGTIVLDHDAFFSTTPELAKLVPKFTVTREDKPKLQQSSEALSDSEESRLSSLRLLTGEASDGLVLLFVEDSQADMGLIHTIFHEWKIVFDLLYDYLVWLLKEEPSEVGETWRKGDIKKEGFLCFESGSVPPEIDLDGALTFLQSLGFADRHDSIGAQRRSFYRGEKEFPGFSINDDTTTTTVAAEGSFIEAGERGGELHQCDFCATKHRASEMVLVDGALERCPDCSRQAVNDFAGLVAVYEEARAFLEKEMRVSLRKAVQVRFASTKTIQERAGMEIIPTSCFDPRVMGLAISEGENRVILIENSAPYHSILATSVHELTHIWQYDNLDYIRMREEYGLLLIEGLAQWVEIECLTSRKLAPEFCAGEKKRGDEYGRGYRLIVQMMQREGGSNPFVMLEKKYGKKG